jgi:nucleotide-binding universal stress UspA family protein
MTVADRPTPADAGRTAPVARVVVPLDGSTEAEEAIPVARAVAERMGVPMSLLGWHWGTGAQWVTHRYLERVLNRWSLDCDIEASWSYDNLAAGPLLDAVRRTQGTLVCMVTHARSGVGEVVLGSVAEDLLRKSTEPALLIGPHVVDPPDLARPVVVTVDGSPLSEAAIPLGAAWAHQLGAPLELVNVLEPTLDPDVMPPGDASESGYLAGLVQQWHADSWEVLHGRPADAIARHAAGHAGLLVASTHGRSGLSRMFMGSVAVRIVHKAPCPVLVQRIG